MRVCIFAVIGAFLLTSCSGNPRVKNDKCELEDVASADPDFSEYFTKEKQPTELSASYCILTSKYFTHCQFVVKGQMNPVDSSEKEKAKSLALLKNEAKIMKILAKNPYSPTYCSFFEKIDIPGQSASSLFTELAKGKSVDVILKSVIINLYLFYRVYVIFIRHNSLLLRWHME